MKSVNQLLESAMHKNVRMKIRACTQPGIIDQEMQSFLSDILNNKLNEEQDILLKRKPYQRGGDGRKRNGYQVVKA
jgi:hypothetical protein